MKIFRKLAALILIPAVFLLAGCGNTSMLEDYSFGYTQLIAGSSEVFLMTPFQLAQTNKQSENGAMYAGSDQHINIMAAAEPAEQAGKGRVTPESLAETYKAMLEQTTDVSNLKNRTTSASVGSKPAVASDYTYDEPLNGKKTSLVVKNLFFEDGGQIWHIMYMYRDGDGMGQEVAEHIFGKIRQ